MLTRWRATVTVLSACLLAFALIFSSAVAATAAVDRNAKIVHAQLDPVPSLDPANPGGSMTAQEVFRHIYENLVRFDADFNVQPALAERWEVSPDGRSWTFYLRKGVSFHDGTPVNAHAVKFTFDRIQDPEQASAIRSLFTSIQSVEVVDEYIVRFTTYEPFGPMLNYLAHGGAGIVSPAAVEKWGRDFRLHPVGAGPYRLKEFRPGEKVVLERYEDYWAGPAAIKEIEFVPVPEDSTRAFMLEAGEADSIVPAPVNMLSRLRANPNIQVINKPILTMMYVGFNLTKPIFQDPLVRQALTHAIDREALVDRLMLGAATVADSPMAVGTFGYKSVPRYPYDPQKARDLLTQAGWVDEDGDGIREKNGVPLAFELWTPQGLYVRDVLLAQTIQAWWRAVGADVRLRQIEAASWYDSLKVPEAQASYDAFLWSLTPSTGDGYQQLVELVLSDSDPTRPPMAWNLTRYKNPEVDRLIREAGTVTDPELRRAALGRAQEIVVEDAPLVFLYSLNQLVAHRTHVKDVVVLPNRFVEFRAAYVER